MSAVADKLREAKALVERGWCKHAFTSVSASGGISFCTVGALDETLGEEGDFNSAVAALKRANKIRCTLFSWNDAPERTQAEVLAAFDKAIQLAEAGL